MYVCVCNAITDKQIRAAAEAGTTELWRLQAELGVATNCGSCSEVASEILAEYASKQPAANAPSRKQRGSRPVVYEPGLCGALPTPA